MTKIQKIETSTIWETCKALDTCHEKPFTLSRVQFKHYKMTCIIPIGWLCGLPSYRARLSSTGCTVFQLLLTVSRNCKTWPEVFLGISCIIWLSEIKAWRFSQMDSIFVLKQSRLHFISIMKCNSYEKYKQKYQWYMRMYCVVQTLLTTTSEKITDD